MENLSKLLLNLATARELRFKYENSGRFFYMIIDTLLGILILHFFIEYQVFDYLPAFTNKTVKTLDFIIEWILHHPGGLKLNTQLNSVLAAFFRGHIQLWKAYMFVLYRSHLSQIISFSALAGASIFLSACSDLIILTTMHFFCFYIYTVRLLTLTWTALKSFWRAFRSKKWNPLKQREDSVELDSREMFMVTLLFISTIFLLPTVLVYFTVFYLLWIMLSSTQKALEYAAQSVRLLTLKKQHKVV